MNVTFPDKSTNNRERRKRNYSSDLHEIYQQGKKDHPSRAQFDETTIWSKVFDNQYLHDEPNVFIETSAYKQLLGQLSGLISRIQTYSHDIHHLVVVGPDHVGKSSALQDIADYINQVEENSPTFMQFLRKTRKEDDSDVADIYSLVHSLNFEKTCILALDDFELKQNTVNWIGDYVHSQSKFDKVLIISTLNLRQYLNLYGKKNSVPLVERFDFLPCSINEVVEIINNRLENIGYSNFIPRDVLTTLGALSFGLPGLALWFIQSVIHQSQDPAVFTDNARIHKIASFLDYSPALRVLSEINRYRLYIHELTTISPQESPLVQAISSQYKINKSWNELIKTILESPDSTVQRSELQERDGIAKDSSLTYQCQRLVQDKIVKYEKNGRNVNYSIITPVKEALELTLYNDLVLI